MSGAAVSSRRRQTVFCRISTPHWYPGQSSDGCTTIQCMKADTAVQCYQLLSSGAIIVYYFNSTQLGTTTRVLLQYLGCYKSAIFKHVVTTVLYYFSTSGTTSWSYSILGTTSGCYFNIFGTTNGCYFNILGTTNVCYFNILGTTNGCYLNILGTTNGCYINILGTTNGCYFNIFHVTTGCYWNILGVENG